MLNLKITFFKLFSNVFYFHNRKAQLGAVVLSINLLLRNSGTSNISLIYWTCREKIGYLLHWQLTSDLHFTIAFLSWRSFFELWGNRLALEGRQCSTWQWWQQNGSLLPHLASRGCCWFPGSWGVMLAEKGGKMKDMHQSYVPPWTFLVALQLTKHGELQLISYLTVHLGIPPSFPPSPCAVVACISFF